MFNEDYKISPSKATQNYQQDYLLYDALTASDNSGTTVSQSSPPIKQENYIPLIIWKPFDCFRFLPFIGHVGIQDCNGDIYDYRSNNNVGVNKFGRVCKYIPIDDIIVGQSFNRFQVKESIRQITELYCSSDRQVSKYGLFSNNCHHYVGTILNVASLSDQYTIICIWIGVCLRAKRVGRFKGCLGWLRLYMPFICFMLLIFLTIAVLLDYELYHFYL